MISVRFQGKPFNIMVIQVLDPITNAKENEFEQLYEVFLPGKSHGWRNLVGYSPWACKESDTTEQLHFSFFLSSAFSKSGLSIWKFSIQVLLKPSLKDFEHNLASM